MRVDYLILADAAEAPNGKHYIHGGGWDTISATRFPVRQNLAIAARLAIPWHETNQPLTLEIDVVDADGRSILPDPPGPVRGNIVVGRPPTVGEEEEQHIPMVFNLTGVTLEGPGVYAVVVRQGENGPDLDRSVFRVRGIEMGSAQAHIG
jgi:hypothetical protein